MKHLLLVLITLLPFTTSAVEYQFDVGYSQVEHAWRGEDKYAQFTDTLNGVGLTAWYGNIGIRGGYIKGKDLNTAGRFKSITIRLKHIISLEVLCRYQVTDYLSVMAGIGTYKIPLPQYWKGINPKSHAATDADDDEGYILGAQIDLDGNWGMGWRFTHYSRIKSNTFDEWTKGHSLYVSYKF